MKSIRISEAISDPRQFVDEIVTIHGILYIDKGGHFFIADELSDPPPITRRLQLLDRALSVEVMKTIDGWVGGPLYQDNVRISGTLVASVDPQYELGIKNVSEFSLFRNGATFQLRPK